MVTLQKIYKLPISYRYMNNILKTLGIFGIAGLSIFSPKKASSQVDSVYKDFTRFIIENDKNPTMSKDKHYIEYRYEIRDTDAVTKKQMLYTLRLEFIDILDRKKRKELGKDFIMNLDLGKFFVGEFHNEGFYDANLDGIKRDAGDIYGRMDRSKKISIWLEKPWEFKKVSGEELEEINERYEKTMRKILHIKHYKNY